MAVVKAAAATATMAATTTVDLDAHLPPASRLYSSLLHMTSKSQRTEPTVASCHCSFDLIDSIWVSFIGFDFLFQVSSRVSLLFLT